MNPEKNTYIPNPKKLEVNLYKPSKEKYPFKTNIKEENPYLLKLEKNSYHKKHEENLYQHFPKQEENPYLKKKDGNFVLIEEENSNIKKDKEGKGKEEFNEKFNQIDQQQKPSFDVKVSDPIITNPECPIVTEVGRFRLRNVPIHKDNPYANWKLSTIKDIDPNHEAKCLKTTTNVDGHNIRIDSFTVTPKPVNNEYLIKLDWKINEEFIDAVRIEQGASIESNEYANEDVKDKQTKFNVDKHDKVEKNEQIRVNERRNSIQNDSSGVTTFETTQFGNDEASDNKINDDKEKSGRTFCAVDAHDDPEKSLNRTSSDESKELIIVDAPLLTPNIVKEETNIAKKESPSFNEKFEVLKKQLNLLFENQKLEMGSNQTKDVIVTQISESEKSLKPVMENEINQPNKMLRLLGNRLIGSMERKTNDENRAEQQATQVTLLQNKKKYPAQLNVKFNQEIGYDHNRKTLKSKLPDNTPTFILVGDRFVREDKVLIDLDINDLAPAPNSISSGNTSPSQVKLPPELQEIDYEGWRMQQIVEEFQHSLQTNNNQPKVKPSEAFLEEFER